MPGTSIARPPADAGTIRIKHLVGKGIAFADDLKNAVPRDGIFRVWDNIYFWSSAQLGVSVRMLVHSSHIAVSLLRTLPRSVAQV